MEFGRHDIRNYTRRAAVLATASLAIAAFNGCDHEETTPNPPSNPPTFDIDRDGDGAPNSIDPYPDVANPTDWDADGTPNDQDLYAHDSSRDGSEGRSVQPPPPQPPATPAPNPGNSTQSSCPGDKDCDSIPDYDDVYPLIPDHTDSKTDSSRTDSDGDGLTDNRDTYPNTRDRDGDGKDDGYDSDPTNPEVE